MSLPSHLSRFGQISDIMWMVRNFSRELWNASVIFERIIPGDRMESSSKVYVEGGKMWTGLISARALKQWHLLTREVIKTE